MQGDDSIDSGVPVRLTSKQSFIILNQWRWRLGLDKYRTFIHGACVRTSVFVCAITCTLAVFTFFPVGGALSAADSTAPAVYQEAKIVDRVHLQFREVPNVQDLGCLMAREHRLFEKEGLPTVEFLWDESSNSLVNSLADGHTDFLFSWMAEGVKARANGKKLVAVALIAQKTSACVIVRNDLNPTIKNIKNLNGKRISVWHFNETSPIAFFNSRHIDVQPVVQRASTNALFEKDLVHGAFTTAYSFGLLKKYSNYRDHVVMFKLSEQDCRFPENTLFCRESFLKEHGDIVKRVVTAIYKGWESVVADPDKAVRVLSDFRRSCNLNCDQYVLRQQLDEWLTVLNLTKPLDSNGGCDQARYDALVKAMIEGKLISEKNPPAFGELFQPVFKGKPVSSSVPAKVSGKAVPAPKTAQTAKATANAPGASEPSATKK